MGEIGGKRKHYQINRTRSSTFIYTEHRYIHYLVGLYTMYAYLWISTRRDTTDQLCIQGGPHGQVKPMEEVER